MAKELKIGAIGITASSGTVTVIDKDRLCYLVHSINRGAAGDRTISKALLAEFHDYYLKHKDTTSKQAREALVGKSNIDKFEYGYESTLLAMSKMLEDEDCIEEIFVLRPVK